MAKSAMRRAGGIHGPSAPAFPPEGNNLMVQARRARRGKSIRRVPPAARAARQVIRRMTWAIAGPRHPFIVPAYWAAETSFF